MSNHPPRDEATNHVNQHTEETESLQTNGESSPQSQELYSRSAQVNSQAESHTNETPGHNNTDGGYSSTNDTPDEQELNARSDIDSNGSNSGNSNGVSAIRTTGLLENSNQQPHISDVSEEEDEDEDEEEREEEQREGEAMDLMVATARNTNLHRALGAFIAIVAQGEDQATNQLDPESIDYESVHESDALPRAQPAERLVNPLKLDYIGSRRILPEGDDLPIFRDNVAASSASGRLLFVGCRETLLCYEYDAVNRLPHREPSFRIRSRPANTTMEQRDNAVWPVQPHNINLVKVGKLNGREVVATLADDGRTCIWLVEEFIDGLAAKAKAKARENNDSSLRISALQRTESHNENYSTAQEPIQTTQPPEPSPIVTLENESSAWGTDFFDELCLVAISDNSRRVTVYDLSAVFGVADSTHENNIIANEIQRNIPAPSIPRVRTPFMGHNVPDVVFLTEGFDDSNGFESRRPTKDWFQLASTSISGHVSLWSLGFPKSVDEPTTIHSYYTGNLGEDGWTVSYFTDCSFVEMPSIAAATGIDNEDEEELVGKIMSANHWVMGQSAYSKLVDECEQKKYLPNIKDSNLPMSRGITVHVPCQATSEEVPNDDDTSKTRILGPAHSLVDFSTSPEKLSGEESTVYYQRTSDSRVVEQIISRLHDTKRGFSPNRFLVCTTKAGIALLRAEDCLCNAYNKDVFAWRSRFLSDEAHFDRLNIVASIPELGALIVVSQLGIISLFRLTSSKGVYAMRQEYVFPRVHSLLYSDSDVDRRLRPLAGLTVHAIEGTEKSRFRIHVLYLDGLLLSYEVCVPLSDDDLVL